MLRTPRTLLFCVAMTAGLLGCSPTPERAFKEMKKAACEGDVAGVFFHINKNKTQKWHQDSGSAKGGTFAGADLGAPAPLNFVDWENDIKKGQSSDFCAMELISGAEFANTGTVRFKTGAGRERSFQFEREGDHWFVTGVD